jgi:hypothetical protein
LVGKPEGKRPLGRPRRRWVDNIKMDLREVWWDGRDWIYLAQDRDRWRAYVNAGKFSSSCTIGGFSRRTRLHEWVSDMNSERSLTKFVVSSVSTSRSKTLRPSVKIF